MAVVAELSEQGCRNEYEVRGDDSVLFLRRRDGSVLETIISTSDLSKILSVPVRWHAYRDSRSGALYVAASRYVGGGRKRARNEHFVLARVLMDAPEGSEVDHIDRNPLNNRRDNLRVVSHAVNMRNKSMYRNNTSGYVGVGWNRKSGRWQAYFKKDGRQVYVGMFDDPATAAQARESAMLEAMA